MKVGDVVKLKSGGFPMTVEDVDSEHSTVSCVSFNLDGKLEHSEFLMDVLELTDDRLVANDKLLTNAPRGMLPFIVIQKKES